MKYTDKEQEILEELEGAVNISVSEKDEYTEPSEDCTWNDDRDSQVAVSGKKMFFIYEDRNLHSVFEAIREQENQRIHRYKEMIERILENYKAAPHQPLLKTSFVGRLEKTVREKAKDVKKPERVRFARNYNALVQLLGQEATTVLERDINGSLAPIHTGTSLYDRCPELYNGKSKFQNK